MKTIGIKLADGTFYPILEEGTPKTRMLDLTTAKDNQSKVQIDLYRSEDGTMKTAEYVDTLEVTSLNPHPNGEPELHLKMGLDENNELTAEVVDPETGKKSETKVELISRTLAERESPADYTSAGASDVVAPVPDFDMGDTTVDASQESQDDTQVEPEETAADSQEATVAEDDFAFPDVAPENSEIDDYSFDDLSSQPEEKTLEADPADAITADSSALPSFDQLNAELDAEEKDSAADFADMPDFTDSTENAEKTDSTEPDLSAFDVPDESSFSDPLDEGSAISSSDSELPDIQDTSFDIPDFDDNSSDSSDNDSFAAGAAAGATASGISGLFNDDTFNDPAFTTADTDNEKTFDTSALDEDTFSTAGLDSFDSDTSDDNSNFASSGSAMDFSDLYDKETLEGEHADLYTDQEETKKKTKLPVIICVLCALICLILTVLVLFVVPSKYNLIKSRNTRYKDVTNVTNITNVTDKTAEDNAADNQDKASQETPQETVTIDTVPEENPSADQSQLNGDAASAETENTENLQPSEETPAENSESTESSKNSESTSDTAEAAETPETPASETSESQPEAEAQPEPEPQPVEETSPAVEDKIVIATEPEKVVPVAQTEAPVKENRNAVEYTIKWGDTLWDISDSYYKNPWKYPTIADYNNIPNPDLIISGQEILIPEE